mmetsp:Transcript_74470/g.212347  ORF Transcript_74470/g.212347 Transcript_74470/m.212347 type:complete len:213 (+) Transcript_74470:208-846(+)
MIGSRVCRHRLGLRLNRREYEIGARRVRNQRGDALSLQVAVVLVDTGIITPDDDPVRIEFVERDEGLQRAAHDLVLGVLLVVRQTLRRLPPAMAHEHHPVVLHTRVARVGLDRGPRHTIGAAREMANLLPLCVWDNHHWCLLLLQNTWQDTIAQLLHTLLNVKTVKIVPAVVVRHMRNFGLNLFTPKPIYKRSSPLRLLLHHNQLLRLTLDE